MPLELFADRVSELGIGIEAAERIAQEFETSRLATLWHMVDCFPEKCGLLVLKQARKPTESAPSPDQGELWEGAAGTGGPEKKVRVQWSKLGRLAEKTLHVPRHKSVPSDSCIARSLRNGTVMTKRERVNLGDLQGTFHVEAAPFTAEDETYVVALFHWPDEMFDGQSVQQRFYQ
jgi:hypothetical protein